MQLPNVYSYEKLARAIAEDNNLRIEFKEGVIPHADNQGVLRVPPPNISWDKEQYTSWLGTIYHEIGHVIPEQKKWFKLLEDENISTQSFYGHLLNLVVDYDNEHYELGVYEGRDRTLADHHAYALNSIRSKMKNAPIDRMSEELKAGLAASAFESRLREDWQPELRGNTFYDSLPPDIDKYYQRLLPHEEELKKDFNALNASPSKGCPLVDKLLKYMEFDAEEQKENSQQQYKNEKEESEEGEKSKAKGKQGEQKQGQEKGKGQKEREVEGVIKWKDIQKHHHDSDRTSTTWHPLTIEYEQDDLQSTAQWKWNPVIIVDYPRKKVIGGILPRAFDSSAYKVALNKLPTSSVFANKVRRLLQVETRNRYYYGKKKGKLHNKNLYRLGMKDAGDFSKRIFKQKDVNTDLDVSVTIFTDNSGSMGGDKFIHGAQSAMALHQVLHAINVPHEILSFSQDRSTIVSILKGFGDNTSQDKLIEAYSSIANLMGGNDDATAVMYAYSRLLKQPTKRKLLIVLSDGQPACYGVPYSPPGALKEITKRIEKEKIVELYGIGIMSDSVKHFYSNYSVIDSSEQLETTLLSVLKNRIITTDRS